MLPEWRYVNRCQAEVEVERWPRMHVRLACWLTSLFVTSSLHVQIARQINKTHGERIATSQHRILNKIDSTLEKELLHSITKGEEW